MLFSLALRRSLLARERPRRCSMSSSTALRPVRFGLRRPFKTALGRTRQSTARDTSKMPAATAKIAFGKFATVCV